MRRSALSVPMIQWIDKILHHFETMGNQCLFLVLTGGESSSQGFLGVAGFRPSTVGKMLSFAQDGELTKLLPTLVKDMM